MHRTYSDASHRDGYKWCGFGVVYLDADNVRKTMTGVIQSPSIMDGELGAMAIALKMAPTRIGGTAYCDLKDIEAMLGNGCSYSKQHAQALDALRHELDRTQMVAAYVERQHRKSHGSHFMHCHKMAKLALKRRCGQEDSRIANLGGRR